MTYPLSSRVLSLALSLWLAVFSGESEWIVRCPAHDGGVSMIGAGAHDAATGHHAAAGADVASHDHGAPTSPQGDYDAGHRCSCPGPGCCPPAIAVVPGSIAPLDRLIAVHEARATSALERFEDEPDYLLPPATAPPTRPLAPAA